MNIWVVDDSKAIRSLMSALTKRIMTETDTVNRFGDGESVLIALDQGGDPDVVLLDVGLPGLSGIEVCAKIREHYNGASDQRPYIIMITSANESEMLAQAIDAGANDYLPKPVNARILDIRLRVASKLAQQARFSEESEYFKSMAMYAQHYVKLPMAICEAGFGHTPLKIVYANEAAGGLMATGQDALVHQSFVDLQAWKPEFTQTVEKILTEKGVYSGAIASSSSHWNSKSVHMDIYSILRPEAQVPEHYLIIQQAKSS